MRVGFIADVHLWNYKLGAGKYESGVNDRARLTAKAIRYASRKLELDELWVLGDLFDAADPSPQLVNLCMWALQGGCEKKILRGNHDMVSTDPGDNALAPLRYLKNVQVVEDVQVFAGDLTVMAFPFPHKILEYEAPQGVDVAVMHCGIAEPDTPDFMTGGVKYSELLGWMDNQKSPVPLLFAGDWHNHATYCRGRVNQCGTFAPKSKSDAFDKAGMVAIVDTDKKPKSVNGVMVPNVEWVEVPGPRFAIAGSRDEAVNKAKFFLDKGCTPFISYPKDAAESGAGEEVEGAHIRAEASAPVHVDALEDGDELRRQASSMDERKLLKKYLKHKHQDDWKKMLQTITAEMS